MEYLTTILQQQRSTFTLVGDTDHTLPLKNVVLARSDLLAPTFSVDSVEVCSKHDVHCVLVSTQLKYIHNIQTKSFTLC